MSSADESDGERDPGLSSTGTVVTQRSPIDWAFALSLTGEDRDLLLDIVEMFPGECADLLASIRSAVESGDPDLLMRSAHSLKGVARCFGAPDLVACALRIEERGRASDMNAARDEIPRLAGELNRVLEALASESIPD